MRSVILISAAAVALAGAAHAQSAKAQRFLKTAMEGDNSEVMLGQLAVAQGGDAATKRFGQMLVHDHSMHLQKVEKLAETMNVPADHQAMAAAEKEQDKLMGLHGAAFDKEFARYMIKDHRKVIADYEKAGRMPGAVGKLARATLPTLHKHLSTAEQIKS